MSAGAAPLLSSLLLFRLFVVIDCHRRREHR
jgi:hypothetical protein